LKKIDPRGIVIIGVFFSSLSSILVRLSDSPSMIIATYRLALTVLMLFPSFYWKNRTESRWMTWKGAILCVASGVFLAFHFLAWFVSLRHTSIASSTILVNTHPIIIVLGSFFILGERVKKKALLYIGMTLAGSLIISLGDFSRGGDSLFGDLMALLGALSVSGYILIGRVVRQHMPLPLYTFTVYLSSTVVLIFLGLGTGTPLYPYAVGEFVIFFALAFFCTIGGHTVLNWALRWVEPAYISTAILGEPVFASLAALFLFKEVPSLYTLLGGAVVISGIYLFVRGNVEKPNPV
jgi:drug/metabolite transporter (DMT)-like permease